jgi:hypothetical protein
MVAPVEVTALRSTAKAMEVLLTQHPLHKQECMVEEEK